MTMKLLCTCGHCSLREDKLERKAQIAQTFLQVAEDMIWEEVGNIISNLQKINVNGLLNQHDFTELISSIREKLIGEINKHELAECWDKHDCNKEICTVINSLLGEKK